MWLGLSSMMACGAKTDFEPPGNPAHIIEKEGHMHAVRYEVPFLCGDPNDSTGFAAVPCPPNVELGLRDRSCDAMGCHGTFSPGDNVDVGRELRGSDGPSCWTCHGQEWDTITQGQRTVGRD